MSPFIGGFLIFLCVSGMKREEELKFSRLNKYQMEKAKIEGAWIEGKTNRSQAELS